MCVCVCVCVCIGCTEPKSQVYDVICEICVVKEAKRYNIRPTKSPVTNFQTPDMIP